MPDFKKETWTDDVGCTKVRCSPLFEVEMTGQNATVACPTGTPYCGERNTKRWTDADECARYSCVDSEEPEADMRKIQQKAPCPRLKRFHCKDMGMLEARWTDEDGCDHYDCVPKDSPQQIPVRKLSALSNARCPLGNPRCAAAGMTKKSWRDEDGCMRYSCVQPKRGADPEDAYPGSVGKAVKAARSFTRVLGKYYSALEDAKP